jgi:class 3 adenylate cyclase
MGLHTGQAVVTDGRYTGLAVHRAARIGARPVFPGRKPFSVEAGALDPT